MDSLTGSGSRAVVGFDDTPPAHAALAYAVGWAQRCGGRLDIVQVVGPVCQDALVLAGGLPVPEVSGCGCALHGPDLVPAVRDALSGTDLRWTFHRRTGEVVRTLQGYADSVAADVVVVGAGRRRPWWRGSTSRRLVGRTASIVIVVP